MFRPLEAEVNFAELVCNQVELDWHDAFEAVVVVHRLVQAVVVVSEHGLPLKQLGSRVRVLPEPKLLLQVPDLTMS